MGGTVVNEMVVWRERKRARGVLRPTATEKVVLCPAGLRAAWARRAVAWRRAPIARRVPTGGRVALAGAHPRAKLPPWFRCGPSGPPPPILLATQPERLAWAAGAHRECPLCSATEPQVMQDARGRQTPELAGTPTGFHGPLRRGGEPCGPPAEDRAASASRASAAWASRPRRSRRKTDTEEQRRWNGERSDDGSSLEHSFGNGPVLPPYDRCRFGFRSLST